MEKCPDSAKLAAIILGMRVTIEREVSDLPLISTEFFIVLFTLQELKSLNVRIRNNLTLGAN